MSDDTEYQSSDCSESSAEYSEVRIRDCEARLSESSAEYSEVGEQPHDLQDVELDYHASSGSKSRQEAYIDENQTTFAGPDGANQTRFYPGDVDDEERWDHLASVNAGSFDTERKQKKRDSWRVVDARTFCNQIGVREEGVKWIINRLEELTLNYGKSSEAVILALLTIYFNRRHDMDLRPRSALSPENDRRVDAYDKLRRECEIDREEIKQLRSLIEDDL